MSLETRLRDLYARGALEMLFPGAGQTPARHRNLIEIARSDLALARLVEAHVDAIAILAEAKRSPKPGLYGVWAAESPEQPFSLNNGLLNGSKMFCTGAALLDRALITVQQQLVDVSLRDHAASLTIDESSWKTMAFAETHTATVTFSNTPVSGDDTIAAQNWYVERPGFWHGACGPAACWAGGAIGLYDYARSQSRNDAHTMAHLAAMHADVWALRVYLECAGNEIDNQPADRHLAGVRALTVRHLVEQASADMLRRLGRAYGPRALAYNQAVSQRYQELDLYIRQSHAERDLEMLGRLLQQSR